MRQKISHLVPLAAGLSVLLLFACGYAVFGLYPFGKNSIVWCDMEQQAVPLLLQLREIFRMGDSICYTVLNAGGMNFLGVFFFFLSNPLSFVVLWTDLPVDMLMNLLVPVKLALAAGTAAVWLRYRIPALTAAPRTLLAVMYGCCGYGLFYYQNLMWLDVQALFPLLLLALDLLLRRDRVLPYIAALTALMLLCYYIGYMVVLYLLLDVALMLRFTLPQAERGSAALRFWLASGIAACLTAVVWMPSLLQVMQSARSGGLLARLRAGYLFGNIDEKLALLGCTAVVFAAVPLLWRRGEKSHEKRLRQQILCVLLCSAMLLDPINRLWHTGSYQAFPFRWAFILILLALTVIGEELCPEESANRFKMTNGERICLVGLQLLVVTSVVVLLCCAKSVIFAYVETLWVSTPMFFLMLVPILLAAVTYFLLIAFQRHRMISQSICVLCMTGVFACELTLNFTCYFGGAANKDDLYADTMALAHAIDDEDFYRVRLIKKYAHANMLGGMGYPSLSHYTSLTRADYMEGIKKMGYSSYWMEVPSTGGTVLTDALWQIRYLIGQQHEFPTWATCTKARSGLSIAKSHITLPMGILTAEDSAPQTELPSGSRSAIQRDLAERMLGASDLVTDYAVTRMENVTLTTDAATGETHCAIIDAEQAAEIRFSIFVPTHQALYFDLYTLTGTSLRNPRNHAVSVYVNGRVVARDYPDNIWNGLVYLGDAEQEYVSVRIVVQEDFSCESFGVFGIQLDALADACAQVKGAAVTYDGKGRYTAHCVSDAPAYLNLAIAYDEGFSAKVNGQAVEVLRLNSCQMAVHVPQGESTIELAYTPRGLRSGFVICVLGGCALLVWLYLRKKPCVCPHLECAAIWLSRVAFAAELLAVYLFPLGTFLGGWLIGIFS